MVKRIFYLLLLAITTVCPIKQEDLYCSITQRYSLEEINFFYEMCFNHPHEQNKLLDRWYTNLYFGFEGASSHTADSLIMCELAATVNTLGLPIKTHSAAVGQQPNLSISFESDVKVAFEPNLSGLARKYGEADTISYAQIIISKTEKDLPLKLVYWHELLHVLGFSSHITTHTDCILTPSCQGSLITTLNQMEKQALRMLYEPVWGKGYSRRQFEKDFANELYHINAERKLAIYMSLNRISTALLEELITHDLVHSDTTMSQPQVVKFAMPLELKLKGDLPPLAKDTLMLIINEINDVCSNVHLTYSNDTLTNKGMFICFQKSKKADEKHGRLSDFYMARNTHGCFSANLMSTITVSYQKDSSINKILGAVVYQILTGSREEKEYNPQPFTFNNGKPYLKPHYQDMLRLYYSPQLPHNFTKSQLEEVMQLLAADSLSHDKRWQIVNQ